MNFMFECARALSREIVLAPRTQNSYLRAKRVMFFLFKHTDDSVFDDFPKISENFQKLFQRAGERSRTFSDNFRRLPKTFVEGPKMFRLYTYEFKYNLTDKLDVSEIIDIFTCEDIISSHARISYRFYQFVTTRYTTDFIIKKRYVCTMREIFEINRPL